MFSFLQQTKSTEEETSSAMSQGGGGGGGAMEFSLAEEILAVIPTGPYEQLLGSGA